MDSDDNALELNRLHHPMNVVKTTGFYILKGELHLKKFIYLMGDKRVTARHQGPVIILCLRTWARPGTAEGHPWNLARQQENQGEHLGNGAAGGSSQEALSWEQS